MDTQILNLNSLIPTEGEVKALFDELWPICRSITGNGVRDSLRILETIMPMTIEEVPTGTELFDWQVPKEWNIFDAYVLDSNGTKVIDFTENNLHVVSYSTPIDRVVTLSELQEHLYSLEDLPDAVPYVTSYYKERWGFCLTHNKRMKLKNGKYRVVIKSTLRDGSLTYGHTLLKATEKTEKEFLISANICHPSMANNELSGPIVSVFLYRALKKMKNRNYNYRFVILPETIGAIAYLADHGNRLMKNCCAGLVVTCCGDDRAVTYKKSKRGDSLIDRIATNAVKFSGLNNPTIRDYFPTGSDERQYCSPGFNLPVGSITRSLYNEYKEYHTSLDNKDFISFKAFIQTIELYLKAIVAFENNNMLVRIGPYCEPMLSKYDLYPSINTKSTTNGSYLTYLYLLSYCDGNHDLVDIADKIETTVFDLLPFVNDLKKVNLLT